MSWAKLKPGESFESLMRRFKKAVERAGILADLRKKESYEKPSVQKKRKQAAARKREMKRQMKMNRSKSRSNKSFKWNKDKTVKIPMAPPKKMSTKTREFKQEFNKKHRSESNYKKPYTKRDNKK